MGAKHLNWYVAYRVANGTAMDVAKDRDEAIDRACAMLGRQVDVQEVGPMVEPPEGKVIGPTEIRDMQKTRLAAWHRLTAEKAGSTATWERRMQAAEDLEREVGVKVS
jgi:hypothetical protein